MKIFCIVVLILLTGINTSLFAQETNSNNESHAHPEHAPFRIALLIGHTLIPEQHAQENFFIPSWGLDVEYWFSSKLGMGLHNDLEIETFVILNEDDNMDELERVTPLVLTFDFLFKPYKGLVFQFGPGVELEKDENYSLLRLGLEYEFEINHQWDIAPTFFYDTRFDGYHTWSIALGVGRRF